MGNESTLELQKAIVAIGQQGGMVQRACDIEHEGLAFLSHFLSSLIDRCNNLNTE